LVLAAFFAAIAVWNLLGFDISDNVARGANFVAVPFNLTSADIRVTDGDTIKVRGRATRLVGFNAPESYMPRCPNEAMLGKRAKARLTQLVRTGKLSFASISCSCPPGTEGTAACNFGRACGSLFSNGINVGDTLIAEGLAVPFRCGITTCPKLPRPWC
jgi:endonuclease YncB( thermonuclease family)